MITLSIRTIVGNAAAVFSGVYGAVTRRAQQAGCSRQTVYDHARQVEQRLQPPAPATPPVEVPVSARRPSPSTSLLVRRLAVTAFAMGISTRQIEDLLRVLLGRGWPRSLDHRSLGRRRGREGQTRPPGTRRGLRPRGPDAGRRRDLFWGRPTLVGIEPASMTARLLRECRRPQRPRPGRSNWPPSTAWSSSSPTPPGGSPRPSRNSPRPAARTPRPRPWSTAWTSSTPRWKPNASWPGTGERAEAAWEKAEAADREVAAVEATRDRRPGRGPGRPTTPGAGRRRRSSRPSVSKRPGIEPTRRSTCSGPTADSTTAAMLEPRSPRLVKDLTRCRTGRRSATS